MNLDNVIFGTARSGNGLLRRIDPRILLTAALVLIVLITTGTNIFAYLILTVFLLIGLFLSGISSRELWANFRPFILIAVFTFLLHLFFSSGSGKIIFCFSGLNITESGLVKGALFAWRIFLFFGITVMVNLCIDPLDISEAFMRLSKPLKVLKFPVDQIGLVIFMAFRFVPLLAEEAQMIHAAQVSRGFNPGGNLRMKLHNYIPFLTALLASSIRRAGNMASALQTRGFYPGRERSSYRIFKIRQIDIVFSIIILILAAVSILLGKYA